MSDRAVWHVRDSVCLKICPPPPLCPWGAAVTVAAAAVAAEVVILKELETQLTN